MGDDRADVTGPRVSAVRGRVRIALQPAERALLAAVISNLDDVDDDEDPGYARLHPPVYLGDGEASAEWKRLMGEQLEQLWGSDRSVFDRVVREDDAWLSPEEAGSFLRTLNRGRLVFAARIGISVAEDLDEIDQDREIALWFTSFMIDELSTVLGRLLR